MEVKKKFFCSFLFAARGTANLTELIVILVVVLILMGLGVPQYFLSRDRATKENAFQSFKALSNALVMYRSEFSRYPANGSITEPLGPYTEVTRYARHFEQVAITTYGTSSCVEAKLADMREVTPYWMVYCPECTSESYCSADNKVTWFPCKKGLKEAGGGLPCP